MQSDSNTVQKISISIHEIKLDQHYFVIKTVLWKKTNYRVSNVTHIESLEAMRSEYKVSPKWRKHDFTFSLQNEHNDLEE